MYIIIILKLFTITRFTQPIPTSTFNEWSVIERLNEIEHTKKEKLEPTIPNKKEFDS